MTYNSQLTNPSTRSLAHVTIGFNEALTLLENHCGESRKTLDKELAEILKIMVFSYFSQYAATLQGELTNVRLDEILENNQFHDFENSKIALDVTMSIIKTTQLFLPGFNSHDQEDCAAILDMQMRDRSSLHIEMSPEAFERFVNGKQRMLR